MWERENFFSLVAFFVRPFYKMMLNKPITLDDMQSVVSQILLTRPMYITYYAPPTHRMLTYGTVSLTSLRMILNHFVSTSVSTKLFLEKYAVHNTIPFYNVTV